MTADADVLNHGESQPDEISDNTANATPIPKDDVEASYVFVAGTDAALDDDLVHSDLHRGETDRPPHSDTDNQPESNPSENVADFDCRSSPLHDRKPDLCVGLLDSDSTDSPVHVDVENNRESEIGIDDDVEGARDRVESSFNEISLERNPTTVPCLKAEIEPDDPAIHDVPVSGEIPDVDENPAEPKNVECPPSPTICADDASAESGITSPDRKKPLTLSGEILVEGSVVDDGGDLESKLEPSEDNKASQVQVPDGRLLEKSGESLPVDLARESNSGSAFGTDLVDSSQDAREQNESAASLTSPSGSCNVSLENGENFSGATVNNIVESSDVGKGVSLLAGHFPTCNGEDASPETDTRESNRKGIDNPDSCPVEIEICSVVIDPETSCPANDEKSEPETSSASIGGEDKVSADATDEFRTANRNLEYPSYQHTSGDQTKVGSDISTSADRESSSPDSLVAADNKLEVGVEYTSAISSRDTPSDDVISSKEEDIGSAMEGKSDLEHVGTDLKSICQEVEGTKGNQKDETLTSFPEDTSDGQNVGVEVVKKPFYFFIRIPRYDDENLKEQIKLAEGQVQERTKARDAIHAKVQMQRANAKEYANKVQAALTEERAARDVFKSKRQEMDSVQSVINKLKNAISVEDIDGRIRNMEHMIEHETLPLREEKQLIREIKQLKQHREQIFSNMGKQDEVQKALEQKDQLEERLKGLRKELDLLRTNLTKAGEVTQSAKKEFTKENEKLNELGYQFKAADGVRQDAYARLQSLKKQQYEKNKHFWGYKDDAKAAEKLALSGHKEQLQHLCIDQVERIMELWNRDDDFRREYIRCNTRSTLRRLRTSDGRSLGPDEEPPVIPVTVNNRVSKDNSVPLTSIPEQEKENLPVKAEKSDDNTGAKVVELKKQMAKTKKPTKPSASLETVSYEDERKEEREEEPRLSKVEEEAAREAEEKRKEEEAAKLKQQLKLEEKAKAKEAMERKKRIAEKAQARAAIRAQKEAEEKEKEREKRARKKERKKANGTAKATTNEDDQGQSVATHTPSSEIPISSGGAPDECADESREKSLATTVKRAQKSRTKATMPAPLRNRGKRRMQSWIVWVAVAALVLVLALFFLANHQLLI